jgi:FkbM family methyltransferase
MLVGLRETGILLVSILAVKMGTKTGKGLQRVLQRWSFFKSLDGEKSVQVLSAGAHEFRVSYGGIQPDDRRVEMALRVPMWDSSDSQVFEQIFLRKEYLQALEWFSRRCPAGEINAIMDVGANIGCAALYFTTKFPDANIFCLEPEAGNYQRLTLNLGLNRKKRIRCHQAALWTEARKLRCTHDFRDGKEWGSRFVEPPEDGCDAQEADAIDIAEFLGKTGFGQVDLFKMDIEGTEAVLLKNPKFKDFLKEKVLRIVMEVHEEFIKTDEAIAVLKSLGFETNVVAEFVCAVKIPCLV